MRKNQPRLPTGLSLVRFILQSAAAQTSEFINHGCTRIDPDKAGESASPHGWVACCSYRF